MYSVRTVRTAGHGLVNYSYLVTDQATRAAALIDPAWQPERLLAALEEEGGRLTHILVTHAHPDHYALAPSLADRFSATLCLGRIEAEAFRVAGPRLHLLDDEDRLRVGETPLRALLTPGHTPGGLCYLFERDCFTGDTVFVEGCGRCDLPGSDAHAMYRSVRRLKSVLPPDVTLHAGHAFGKGPSLPLARVREENLYFHLEDPDMFVGMLTRRSQTHARPFV